MSSRRWQRKAGRSECDMSRPFYIHEAVWPHDDNDGDFDEI